MNPGYCVSQGGADGGGRPAGGKRWPSRGGFARNGNPVANRHLSLLRYASSCPSTSCCKGSTASSRNSRSPRSRGNPWMRRLLRPHEPLYGPRCEGERVYRAFSPFTGPSRGLSDNVVRKPQSGGRPRTMLACWLMIRTDNTHNLVKLEERK